MVSQLLKEWKLNHHVIKGSVLSSLNFPKILFLAFPLSLVICNLSLNQTTLTSFSDLPALRIIIYLLVSLRRCVLWFKFVGYPFMLWGWSVFFLLSKMILRGGCIVLKIGSIISWDSFVDIFLKMYFPTSKTVTHRNEILSFVELEHDS